MNKNEYPRFVGPLRVEQLRNPNGTRKLKNGRQLWLTLWPIELHCVIDGTKRMFRVEAGVETDFASVPRILWRFAPPSVAPAAATIHDDLYKRRVGEAEFGKGVARRHADDALLEGLKASGVGRFTRSFMYRGVRWGGARGWGS